MREGRADGRQSHRSGGQGARAGGFYLRYAYHLLLDQPRGHDERGEAGRRPCPVQSVRALPRVCRSQQSYGGRVECRYALLHRTLDIRAEPIVRTVPDTGDRWWLMQILDAWNDVPAAPGTRTEGNKGGN